MFEQLALLDHPNIVKLHKYWLDASETRARVSHGPGRGGRGTGGRGSRGHPPQLAEPASPPAPQVIFITEYVSSGSLKQFLKKTKKNHKAMNARVWGVVLGCAEHMSGSGAIWDGGGAGRGAAWGTGTGLVPGGDAVLAPRAQPPLPAGPTECIRRQAWKRWCTQILSALR